MKCSLLETKKDSVMAYSIWLLLWHSARFPKDQNRLPSISYLLGTELLEFFLLETRHLKNKRNLRRVKLSVSQYTEDIHESSKVGRVAPFQCCGTVTFHFNGVLLRKFKLYIEGRRVQSIDIYIWYRTYDFI